MIVKEQDTPCESITEHQVWSDLRAIRCINQLQLEVYHLKAFNSRLKQMLSLSLTIFSLAVIALTIAQILTYRELQEKLHLPPSVSQTLSSHSS